MRQKPLLIPVKIVSYEDLVESGYDVVSGNNIDSNLDVERAILALPSHEVEFLTYKYLGHTRDEIIQMMSLSGKSQYYYLHGRLKMHIKRSLEQTK